MVKEDLKKYSYHLNQRPEIPSEVLRNVENPTSEYKALSTRIRPDTLTDFSVGSIILLVLGRKLRQLNNQISLTNYI